MLHTSGDEVRLTVRVQPRARSNAIAGTFGNSLRVRLTAPPVDGAANDALITLLATSLGVPRSAVNIVAGATARDKIVGIRGVSVEAVRRALLP
jgi:uncharacterized protein (TIGR00251 family)